MLLLLVVAECRKLSGGVTLLSPPSSSQSHQPLLSPTSVTHPNFSTPLPPKHYRGGGEGGDAESRGHGSHGDVTRGGGRFGKGFGGSHGGRARGNNILSSVGKWVEIIAGVLDVVLLVALVVQSIRALRDRPQG